MSFEIKIEDILKGLSEFDLKAKAAMGVYADMAGKKMEDHAKKNAKWIDRTGIARKTIQGGKQWRGDSCHVYVAGNTEYFPYLELAHDKKYAILVPTRNKLAPEIFRGLSNMLGK